MTLREMRLVRGVAALLSIAVVLSVRPARAQEALRLEDAVKTALTNNERAQKAPLRVETAEGQADRARAAFFPTLIGAGTEQLHATADKTGRNATTTSTVTLTQPIVNPSAFPLYAQARHQRESERWGAMQDRRQLAFDTARAFLQTLAAERVLEAAVRRLDRSKANVDDTTARAEAQLSSTSDVTRAKLDLATAQSQLATAQGSAQRARISLGFLMGRKVDAALAAPERTTRAAQGEGAGGTQIAAAVDRRPDVRSAHERTEALRLFATEPYYRLLPTLSAQGQLRMLPDPLPTERAVDETLTLNLSWSVFDSGLRYADLRTRRSQHASQALDEKLLRRSVETDVNLALASLRAARESYRVAEEAVASANQLVEETQILYRQGLARALEVTDANSKRFDAEVTRASAKLSMEQAYLELRFALGYGPVDDDTAGVR